MKTQETQERRKRLSEPYKRIKKDKKISSYKMVNNSSLSYEDIRNIEEGIKNYTIDKLLEYIRYIYNY